MTATPAPPATTIQAAAAKPAAATPILRIADVSMVFGGLKALSNIRFDVNHGEILSLIGPNGAGKTTLFNCVTGVYRPTSGGVEYRPDPASSTVLELTRRQAHERAWIGITRTFQNIRLFDQMTALENVVTGMHAASTGGLLAAWLRFGARRREEERIHAEAFAWLRYVGLADRAERPARDLPYGERRRVEIARALAARPKLICLDEPAAGMNPTETADLMALIRSIRAHGVTVFLIEHDMKLVMDISDRVIVLDSGRQIAGGLPAEVRANPEVITAYLGGLADGGHKPPAPAVPASSAAATAGAAAAPAGSPTPAAPPLLHVADLRVSYGVGEVLHGIGFDIHAGQVVTIIGANGAGKSTTLRALSGIAPKAWGTVYFLGAEVMKGSPGGIVGAGLV
ncbi:MAG: ATP-binding cassette domain-containing protein, partial [Planctomycetota bacterium]